MIPALRWPKRELMGKSCATEAVLEATRNLDQQSVEEILSAIHRQDRVAVEAVGKVLPDLARAVDVLVCTLSGGGRWFNVGAGTSGRMGALDAAEIPPTFGLPPDRVQSVIAGGTRALSRSVEQAEDNADAAMWELRERGLGVGDAVVAISASGRTPYALGSLEVAHELGARRIAVTSDSASPLADAAEIAIVPETGPEVIAGSTRMKAGLSQKMVLHLLSTTTMVRLGLVKGNRMTHAAPASSKLRDRAVHIVMDLGGLAEAPARRLVNECDGSAAAALDHLARTESRE